MTAKPKDWLTKAEQAMRHAAKCWMCEYSPLGDVYALTKDSQVMGFAHAQAHNTELLRSQFITVPIGELRELEELSKLAKKPAFLVAMFSDFGVYVHTEAIRRPLDIRLGSRIDVHINAGQFTRLQYEGKF